MSENPKLTCTEADVSNEIADIYEQTLLSSRYWIESICSLLEADLKEHKLEEKSIPCGFLELVGQPHSTFAKLERSECWLLSIDALLLPDSSESLNTEIYFLRTLGNVEAFTALELTTHLCLWLESLWQNPEKGERARRKAEALYLAIKSDRLPVNEGRDRFSEFVRRAGSSPKPETAFRWQVELAGWSDIIATDLVRAIAQGVVDGALAAKILSQLSLSEASTVFGLLIGGELTDIGSNAKIVLNLLGKAQPEFTNKKLREYFAEFVERKEVLEAAEAAARYYRGTWYDGDDARQDLLASFLAVGRNSAAKALTLTRLNHEELIRYIKTCAKRRWIDRIRWHNARIDRVVTDITEKGLAEAPDLHASKAQQQRDNLRSHAMEIFSKLIQLLKKQGKDFSADEQRVFDSLVQVDATGDYLIATVMSSQRASFVKGPEIQALVKLTQPRTWRACRALRARLLALTPQFNSESHSRLSSYE